MRPVIWLGDSRVRIKAFPEAARREAGFRIVYVAKFAEAVYVLHAFQKKSSKTARIDVEAAGRRFNALVAEKRRWPKG